MMSQLMYKIPEKFLEEGFVYLHEAVPSIQYSSRYAMKDNFLGEVVEGYKAPYVVVSVPLAEALERVQETLAQEGLELVVYDAYRPQSAVENFYHWSQDPSQLKMKDFFYPFYKKEELFERGFIARRSAHTRGAAVDLTLILKGHKLLPPDYTVRLLEDGRLIPFIDDGTIDMGSSFDLFHEVSEISTPLVSLVAQNRRDYLQKVMSAHGFKGYSKEWWHFQLIDEPFPDTYFDFPIVAS